MKLAWISHLDIKLPRLLEEFSTKKIKKAFYWSAGTDHAGIWLALILTVM